jgi:hypothetical protein
MSNTRNVIGVYRNMLRLAKSMRPEVKKRETILLIRKEFRLNAAEEDAGRVATLLEKASSSLGYLKIITPRTAVHDKQAGHTRIVFGGAGGTGTEVVNGVGTGGKKTKATSNWTGRNPDPDQVARHYAGLKRAGFTDNKSVVGSLF